MLRGMLSQHGSVLLLSSAALNHSSHHCCVLHCLSTEPGELLYTVCSMQSGMSAAQGHWGEHRMHRSSRHLPAASGSRVFAGWSSVRRVSRLLHQLGDCIARLGGVQRQQTSQSAGAAWEHAMASASIGLYWLASRGSVPRRHSSLLTQRVQAFCQQLHACRGAEHGM